MQHIQKALGNCAVSTVQPASFVALSDHNGAIAAAFATAIPHSVNFVSGILLRTDDNPDIRTQRPAVRPPISNLLRAEALDDSPPSNCSIRDIVFTERDKQPARLASPSLRDGTPAMRGLSISYGLGRKLRRSHERSTVLGSALSPPLSPGPC